MPPPTEVHKDRRLSREAQKMKQEMDDILDEIDEVLEENAQEFVEGYKQKGGE